MDDARLEEMLDDLESDRVERKASLSDPGKIRQAVCAFANDLPNHGTPGTIFVGVADDGRCLNTPVTDLMLRTLADMRSDGNILPFPVMTVQKRRLKGADVAVVVVEPSDAPPVRYNGRTWIRVGSRRATATAEEERRLSEKRRSRDLPFDLRPMSSASLSDLDSMLFEGEYLPSAVAPDILEQNKRTQDQQLASVRFVTSAGAVCPTVLGLLVIGKSPADFLPGAYVQFLRVDGVELTDGILDQKEVHGPVPDLMRRLDDILDANIVTPTEVTSSSKDIRSPSYPKVAFQQLIRNAVMHRDYETSHAPVRISWFRDRVEIQNPGGPFGQVTGGNFGQPGITDYRNPYLAEAMKVLGFVQRFGVGIQMAKKALADNGNPEPVFDVRENHVLVVVRSRP